ncbi:MAG TPA: hypothetical protein VM661_06705 [Candidatus Sulfotelmatobacter sp.]|jgi:hypothetical protein|nr:hypothetical protein [Candidatus Sulfotelmatobacter sp.]
MRPLESHVEISSQLWMFNRVKELLQREGVLSLDSSDEEICRAISHWSESMAQASHGRSLLTH